MIGAGSNRAGNHSTSTSAAGGAVDDALVMVGPVSGSVVVASEVVVAGSAVVDGLVGAAVEGAAGVALAPTPSPWHRLIFTATRRRPQQPRSGQHHPGATSQ